MKKNDAKHGNESSLHVAQRNKELNEVQIGNIKSQSNSHFSPFLNDHFEAKNVNVKVHKTNDIKSSLTSIPSLEECFNCCQGVHGNEISNIESQQKPCFAPSLDEDLSWFTLDEKLDLSEFNPKEVFSDDSM